MRQNSALTTEIVLEAFEQLPEFKKLHLAMGSNLTKPTKPFSYSVLGLIGSSQSFFSAALYKNTARSLVIVLSDKEEAAYLQNDLEQLLSKDKVHFFPSSYRRPYAYENVDNANVMLRAEVLNKINQSEDPLIIVTYPEALFEKVVTRTDLNKKTQSLKKGDKISLDFLNEVLFEYEFKRVDFVTEPGEFSVRGGIVDVFSFSNDQPYRIEFFGDEVDSLRYFDVASQLSTGITDAITIIPNVAQTAIHEQRQSFFEYLSKTSLLILKNNTYCKDQIETLFDKAEKHYADHKGEIKLKTPNELFLNRAEWQAQTQNFDTLHWGGDTPYAHEVKPIDIATEPQPAFNKKFDLLADNLRLLHDGGITPYLFCATQQQAKRLHDIFEDLGLHGQYQTIVTPIYQGFILPQAQLACYTDHQIFERYHRFNIKNGYAKKEAISLNELNKLEIGDYVTHIDHGIGKFGGLQKIEVEGNPQEAIKLIYGDRDILYVSIHSLHKISKYNGKDGAAPKIYKLGSPAWKKLKQKTKTKVKQIAFDLITIYAKRRLEKGFQYAADSYLQNELEASFLYEDTPDQAKATDDVKMDMESERPMDRLICGDVGFGKTEVAIRAAFKAVDNGKQVAVLVPTTILAFQHHNTFSKRLEEFPVTVDYLNRFRTAKEKKEILEKLALGKIDIIIGTHQLVNKNVKFKDLGLLVVDEEQKFGVGVKDKLKTIKENVDVLTLTATPIPRTLQFSLMAARDLSVINTPPPNRFPIESQVIGFNEEIIRDAVSYELQRDGQVFFVHNRIENIKEIAGMIQRLVPDAKVRVGHGQMDGQKLEEMMVDFMEGGFDVLVSTTIIESGLDVPNANTIFINNANNFGLSDLHQMRGRVGRSNKKAFCYFITPPYEVMTPDARKRIEALEQFTALGSGFNIAMKDLEIRGAGDILGGEQSGFINEIGFETYQKIMSEAIEELKENEFKELYEALEGVKANRYIKEIQIDTDFEILFPDNYINNVSERLAQYTALNEIENEEDLKKFTDALIDRFGTPPKEAIDLIQSIKIKWIGKQIGLEKIVMKNGKLLGYFLSDQQSAFYQSADFHHTLQYIAHNPQFGKLKEKETRNGLRLLLVLDHIKSVAKAVNELQKLIPQKEKNTHEV